MDDEVVVNQVLTDYYRAFSTLDMQAILPYYLEPCLLLSPQGVIAVPTRSVLVAIYTPVIEGLRARGYGRSELSMPYVKQLSATTTFASGVAIRYKADGQELERVSISYLLQKADNRWMIAVSVIHDSDKIVRPE